VGIIGYNDQNMDNDTATIYSKKYRYLETQFNQSLKK